MNLQTPIKNAGRYFKIYAKRLEKLGIYKLEDLLYHIPSRYEDFSHVFKISQVRQGEVLTIQGKVLEMKNVFTKNYKKIQQAKVQDDTGIIDIIWFNQLYLTKVIHAGDPLSLSGRVEINNRRPVLYSPEYEILNDSPSIHTGRLVPIYPETKGVSSKWLRRQIHKIIHENKEYLKEYIPDSILKDNKLIDYFYSIQQIHFPDTLTDAVKAKERLSFDEIFLLQLASALRRQEWQKDLKGKGFEIQKFQKDIMNFWEQLPFELTGAQKKAVKDIFADIAKPQPMNRLLQGDVGSGKTVVSAIGMYLAYLNGFQSVLIAPTEILAKQHFQTIDKLVKPLGVKVTLVTGSKKKSLNTLYSPLNTNILVGTHAVLSEKIAFKNLGFIVIDEQQRFGVEQRAILRKKGSNPHVLTMTATPIPRTIALTMYGDLDLSVIDEMPKNRKKIKTWLVPNKKREQGYRWIEKQIIEYSDQAFIICPFIEESESMITVKAATKEYEYLQKEVFTDLKLGLLHGKMKSKEKDAVLQDFRDKKIDILVATPVVEVGIDIPNATIIVIEAAERFGLAQLHQLRGRVGRGDKQSYCLLFTASQSPQTRSRLSAMETMHVGAELAELDLKLRGPGEMYGTLQSGQKMLKIASFSDFVLIEKAKRAAESIFPEIEKYPLLMKKLQEVHGRQVSPD